MKLLVPTNFSKIADDALSSAVKLSRQIDTSSIVLLQFVKSSTISITDIEKEQANISPPVLEQANAYFAKAKSSYADLKISFVVITYINEADLFKSIESLKVDLIVMGTQEVERYENEKLIGEHTRKFIKNIQTPIVCLRGEIVDTNFKKVVFATNLKDTQIADFNKLSAFFAALNLFVEVLIIVTPEKFITTPHANKAFEATSKMLQYHNVTFKVYNEVGVAEGVIGYCKHHAVDLLILPTQGRKGLDLFFNGSISEVIMDEVRMPVISVLE